MLQVCWAMALLSNATLRCSPSGVMNGYLKRELTEVMNRKQKLARAIRSQFRQPRGVAGWLAGWEMALRSSNRQRNVWAVGLLGVAPTDRVLVLVSSDARVEGDCGLVEKGGIVFGVA